MDKEFMLQSDFSAAKLCGLKDAEIVDSEYPYVVYTRCDNCFDNFSLSNKADLLDTIVVLMKRMVSIRATDAGTGHAYYFERFDTWGTGERDLEQAVRHAVLALEEE